MALARFPTYLRLVGAPRIERRAGKPANVPSVPEWNKDLATGIATRQALLERLSTVGTLAPTAPLSFVAACIEGAEGMDVATLAALQRAVGARLKNLTRATDLVGRVDDETFGVVLQGTGSTAAGAVASRLAHHLNKLPGLPRHGCIVVSAATGNGGNAETLAAAALDSFEVCAG